MAKTYYYFKQCLFYFFLIVYIFLLAKVLLFKEVSPFDLFNADRTISRTLSLTPFKTIIDYFSSTHFNLWIALMNVVGNIVLFIPLGMYLQIFKRNKTILNCVALSCAISLCVEVTQYILGIGRTDIDDIILNTLGGLLGIFIYKIIYLLLKDENKTRTAVTFLYCLICICFSAWYFILVNFAGMKIKIL